jgi:hypothetical protein
MKRHHHYERAFEGFLRARRIPYVAVDEARKALVPAALAPDSPALKSFDFVIYGIESSLNGLGGLGLTGNLLVDIKGRRISSSASRTGLRTGRMETWATLDDVESLAHWERLFGEGFQAAFVFVYACDAQPPDALFQEVFEDRGTWYALRAVTLSAYRAAMKTRSPKWRTVDIPRRVFEQISTPLTLGFGRLADPGPELAALA